MGNKGRIVLAGGSGLIGTCLAGEAVSRGYEVVVLTRGSERVDRGGRVRFVTWDGRTAGKWRECISGADAIVNLAGRSVNCVHTRENRSQILESRLDSVKLLGEAIRECVEPPVVWIQAGSLAIYGDTGDRWCAEDAVNADDFPARVCREWEDAFNEHVPDRVRSVVLRIGIVLYPGEGALGTLEKLVKAFLGGAVSHGRQYLSWIHWRDMNRVLVEAIENQKYAGAFNVCAPNPANNAEFMRLMRKSLNRPWCPPAPKLAVQIGGRLIGTEPSLALTGRRCRPDRLEMHGFHFRYTELDEALAEIYGEK